MPGAVSVSWGATLSRATASVPLTERLAPFLVKNREQSPAEASLQFRPGSARPLRFAALPQQLPNLRRAFPDTHLKILEGR